MTRLLKRYEDLRNEGTSPAWYFFETLCRRFNGSRIATHQSAQILGRENIRVAGMLRVGVGNAFGFLSPHDRTLLNIRGKLSVNGNFSLGRGCRMDVGPGAQLSFGSGYTAPFCKFVIMHALEIGDECAISWNCEFLDEDFHHFEAGAPTGAPIR